MNKIISLMIYILPKYSLKWKALSQFNASWNFWNWFIGSTMFRNKIDKSEAANGDVLKEKVF